MKTLARIEQSVRASDGEAILARWDFGRAVLEQRVGKQLPKGLRDAICECVKLGHQELTNRVRVAEHYDRQEVSRKLDTSPTTWTALVDGLPKKKRATPLKPTQPPVSTPEPTKAAIAKADRVEALIVEPDVATVLSRRAADDDAARKAQTLAERRQRAEAKAQKERDQKVQQRQQVLRLQLINGDTNWQNLTDQMETMADTVTRLVALLDGLPIPDPLHRKMFDRHLAAAQQALFDLRSRLSPDYEELAAEVWRQSVIEVGAR